MNNSEDSLGFIRPSKKQLAIGIQHTRNTMELMQ